MYTVSATTSPGTVYGYSIPIAVGAGASLQIAYSVAAAKVEQAKVSAAIRFINMVQLGGTTIALTIAGQIFQSYAFRNVKAALSGLDFTDAQVRAAIAGTQNSLLQGVEDQVRVRVLEGIVNAVNKSYLLVIVGGAVTLVYAVFMSKEKLFLKVPAG